MEELKWQQRSFILEFGRLKRIKKSISTPKIKPESQQDQSFFLQGEQRTQVRPVVQCRRRDGGEDAGET